MSGGGNFCVSCMECSTFTVSFLCYGSVVTVEESTIFCAGQCVDLLIFLGSVIVVISLYDIKLDTLKVNIDLFICLSVVS